MCSKRINFKRHMKIHTTEQFPIIETERLILRPWKDEDIAPFAALNADPIVMEFFPKLLSYQETEDMVKRLKAHFEREGWGLMATEIKETGEFIGMIGLNKPHYETPFTPCVEIGWRTKAESWNKGYATEGAKACLEFGFNYLNLNKIAAFTTETNKRSQRIMEKISMTRDFNGDFEHPLLPKGHPLIKHVLYWITDEDYKKLILAE